MKNAFPDKCRCSGFTLMELVVVIAMIAILSAIAIPKFNEALPRFRLQAAARDLYSNMLLAKMKAIKTHQSWAVVFNPTSNSYYVCSSPGSDNNWSTVTGTGANTVVKSVSLTSYGSGVAFGVIAAATGVAPASISYSPSYVVFDDEGMTTNWGYCYLLNEKNDENFAVGTISTGLVKLLKWDGTQFQ